MIVDVFGLEAFLPGSQIDVKPIRDYDQFVNKNMEFRIVKINHEFKNVVVSHKALIEADIEEGKQLHELSLDKLKTLHPLIDADVFHYITYQAAVSAKSIEGGTAPSSVKKQISKINRRITWKKR